MALLAQAFTIHNKRRDSAEANRRAEQTLQREAFVDFLSATHE